MQSAHSALIVTGKIQGINFARQKLYAAIVLELFNSKPNYSKCGMLAVGLTGRFPTALFIVMRLYKISYTLRKFIYFIYLFTKENNVGLTEPVR